GGGEVQGSRHEHRRKVALRLEQLNIGRGVLCTIDSEPLVKARVSHDPPRLAIDPEQPFVPHSVHGAMSGRDVARFRIRVYRHHGVDDHDELASELTWYVDVPCIAYSCCDVIPVSYADGREKYGRC